MALMTHRAKALVTCQAMTLVAHCACAAAGGHPKLCTEDLSDGVGGLNLHSQLLYLENEAKYEAVQHRWSLEGVDCQHPYKRSLASGPPTLESTL